jgi:hypothetical protein
MTPLAGWVYARPAPAQIPQEDPLPKSPELPTELPDVWHYCGIGIKD